MRLASASPSEARAQLSIGHGALRSGLRQANQRRGRGAAGETKRTPTARRKPPTPSRKARNPARAAAGTLRPARAASAKIRLVPELEINTEAGEGTRMAPWRARSRLR